VVQEKIAMRAKIPLQHFKLASGEWSASRSIWDKDTVGLHHVSRFCGLQRTCGFPALPQAIIKLPPVVQYNQWNSYTYLNIFKSELKLVYLTDLTREYSKISEEMWLKLYIQIWRFLVEKWMSYTSVSLQTVWRTNNMGDVGIDILYERPPVRNCI